MKIILCLFEGNCVSHVIFYLFLVIDYNQKHCFFYMLFMTKLIRREVIGQYL